MFPDLFLNACLGALFALCASDRLRVDGALAMPIFLMVLMFVGMIRLPMMLYLYLVHPAWSWHYLFDPASLPSAVLLLVVLGQSAVLIGTWFLGAHFAQAHRRRVVMYVLGGCALALVLVLIALSGRLTVYGSHQDHARGLTQNLMDVKLGYVLIPLILGVFAAAAYVCVELVRDARRVRSL